MLTVSEVQSIIIMLRHSSMQADMVLEKELKVEELHFDLAGNRKWSETLGVA